MKPWMFIITTGLLGLTACTTFHGVTPISPNGDPYNSGNVDNLQPTLEWKSSSKGEETYDVIIFETSWVKNDNLFPHNICELFQRHREMVYYRERIKETYHKGKSLLNRIDFTIGQLELDKGIKYQIGQLDRIKYQDGQALVILKTVGFILKRQKVSRLLLSNHNLQHLVSRNPLSLQVESIVSAA